MNNILMILFLVSGILNAKNDKIIEEKHYLNESLKLQGYFVELNKSAKGIDFFTVGADGACTYSSIQSAIDDYFQSPFANIDIRIATNKAYMENIVIGNANIALTGGYNNCTDAIAGIQSNNQALINANSNGVVLKIQGVTTRRTMTFKNLRLINGNNAAGAGGGLLSDNSNVALLLENVDIRNNTANHGAGVAIVGGDTDLLMNESLVLGNVADYGGGIYCSGGASSVNVANQSGISSNIANGTAVSPSGNGGGAYINGCYFAIFTGSPDNGSFAGMETNSAESTGGAIYAENAIIRLHGHQSCGSLGCLGDDINPVSFRSNQSSTSSTGSGNASVLHAKNSDVRINATWMEGNTGKRLIYLDQSGLLLERFLQPCWSNSDCNLIENNTGVAIVGYHNSDTSISNVTFKDNSGGVFDFSNVSSVRTSVNVESNVFYNNGSFQVFGGSFAVFDIFGAFDFSFIHNTIVDSNSADSIFNLDWNAGIAGTVPPIFEVHSNIVDNPGVLFLTHNANSAFNGITDIDVNISSLITNETDSISEDNGVFNDAINFAGGDFITETVPGGVLFVDRANGDLHLSENSRAIDYYNTPSRIIVTHKDIDYEERGFDDPNIQSPISGLFYFDIGADEYYISDVIFKDGFE